MFRKYIFLILFCLLSSFAAQSQNVPGYLGKRAFVDYNFNLPYPIYLGPKWTNFTHNLNFNYVIRRRAQVGLTVDFFKLHANPEGGNYKVNGQQLYSSVKGGAIGINFDWYTKKSIAPVGNYFRLSAKKLFGNYEDYAGFGVPAYLFDDNYNEFVFACGYGIRRIFFDQIVFNVGGSFGLVTGGATADERGYSYAVASSYIWRFHVGVGVLLF
jgi:hypothetical protein